ncbi:MAG: hypothetical protein JWN46_536 [Acidimicrobiales bacterium]|nr:hypothetical protein [Acidimicrobiales bacterium]
MNPLGGLLRTRRERRERLARLAADEPVVVPCRLRRTTTRGWGPWTTGTLLLGEAASGAAEWQVEDPAAVGLTWAKARRPSPFVDVAGVELRRVRFREEAFHGMDAQIIVVTADRSTTEVALPPDETDPVYDRLAALLSA